MKRRPDELERYHDGELHPDQADAVRLRLHDDLDARRRLDELRRFDALAAQALRVMASEESDPRVSRSLRPGVVIGMAAALAIGCTLAFVRVVHRESERPPVIAEAPVHHEVIFAVESPVTASPGVRTVLEMRIPSDRAADLWARPARTAPATPAPAPGPSPVVADVHEQRRPMELGRSLRSAMSARLVLDAMSDHEQLEACRLWASDPSLRPIVFERLARLQDRPGLAEPCAAIASAMHDDRELVAWIRSHNVRTVAARDAASTASPAQ